VLPAVVGLPSQQAAQARNSLLSSSLDEISFPFGKPKTSL